ncbi:hypothetical protein [Siphonobacter sp. BAB-5405]|nr:hypothetical protein [Siphonobacter sp. BAB-5405]
MVITEVLESNLPVQVSRRRIQGFNQAAGHKGRRAATPQDKLDLFEGD